MRTGTILCVGNFELPDRNAAAHRVVNNAKLFRLLGYETVFLGACRGEVYFKGIVKRDFDAPFEMYEQSYPFSTRQWASQIFDAGNILALARNYPDTTAVLLYNTQYATALAVRKAFAGRDVRLLYDCTEWNAYTEGSLLKRKVKAADSRLIELRLPRRCDGIIAVSTAMRDQYGDKTPLLLLPPLVDLEDPVWRQTPREAEGFTFCYAGSPSDKDRLDLLLNAFARLPKGAASLRVIGVSEKEYAALPRGDAPERLPDNVTFTGRLSHRETVREILGCGCFVFLREPSRRNTAGFPTKFVEAFTCGVPVITTAVSDVPSYADDGCVILRDTAPDSVLAAMRGVLARDLPRRGLRDDFDYRSRADECRRWFERISCNNE